MVQIAFGFGYINNLIFSGQDFGFFVADQISVCLCVIPNDVNKFFNVVMFFAIALFFLMNDMVRRRE